MQGENPWGVSGNKKEFSFVWRIRIYKYVAIQLSFTLIRKKYMKIKYETLHIELEAELREVDMRTLEFLLDRDKLMLSKLVEKLLLKYIHNAQNDENRSSLPMEIKALLAKESAAKNKERKVKALGKFLTNTPYHLRKAHVRFVRSGPNKARVQFPFSKEIVDDIKSKIDTAIWDRATCSWMVRLEDLDTMRDILYQRLGVRGDLEDYDDAWLAAEFGLKSGDIQQARMSIQEGQNAAEPTKQDEKNNEDKNEDK